MVGIAIPPVKSSINPVTFHNEYRIGLLAIPVLIAQVMLSYKLDNISAVLILLGNVFNWSPNSAIVSE